MSIGENILMKKGGHWYLEDNMRSIDVGGTVFNKKGRESSITLKQYEGGLNN